MWRSLFSRWLAWRAVTVTTVLPWPATVTGLSEVTEELYIRHNVGSEHLQITVDPIELSDYDSSFLEINDIQSELNIGPVQGVIVSEDDKSFTIDFNDERAGKLLYYDVEIINIEKG